MNLSNLRTLDSPLQSFTKWYQKIQDGLCQLTSENGVVWHIAVFNGRVHYAIHSLHTPETLEFHLQNLGYGEAIVAGKHILQRYYQESAQKYSISGSAYTWGVLCIQQFESQGILSKYQANHLIDALAKESIETALWETTGTIQQITSRLEPEFPLLSWNGIPFDSLIQTLQTRQQTWHSISDAIQSPYQRPYCTDFSRIHGAGVGGALPIATLKLLVKLMTGRSIRQIAQILKQDELKFAQLLSPYVRQGIVHIQPPPSPFNRLPLVSATAISQPQALSAKSAQLTPNTADARPKPAPLLQSFSGPQTPILNRRLASVQKQSSPLAPPRPIRVPPEGTKGPLPSQKRYKIVCIDDNTSMLEMLEQYLGNDRFDVTTVANPMQSISALFASHPDLVLMDVSMPGINGHRLCQILKRSSAFKNTPIIMVSGNTGALDKAKAKSMGATDYLEKPFSQDALLEIVSRYLEVELPLLE